MLECKSEMHIYKLPLLGILSYVFYIISFIVLYCPILTYCAKSFYFVYVLYKIINNFM